MNHYVIVTSYGQVEEYDAENIGEALRLWDEGNFSSDKVISIMEVNRW